MRFFGTTQPLGIWASVALLVGLLGVTTMQPSAHARVDAETLPTETTSFTQTLPYSVSLSAIGEGGQASTALPIPVGLSPVTLVGKVTAIAASDGVAVISVGTSQTEVSVRAGGTFELAVPAGTVVNSELVLTVLNRLSPQPNELCSYDSSTTVTLADIQIVATGTEIPPTTVADFFSPAVRNITVVVPDAQNFSVNEAALTAMATLSAKYGRDTVITAAVSSDAISPPGPGVRVVVIAANFDATTTLTLSDSGVPTLTLTGPATELSAAAAALGGATLGLAGAPTVSALAENNAAAPRSVFTLADFGTAQPTLAGVGRLTYSTTVSQSRFGGPVSSFTLHLEGGNTPTPPGGIVTATVLWNDLIVDSQSIASTDAYSVDAVIDSTLVKRDNTLTIRLEAIPPGGYCSTTPLPAELGINGSASTIAGQPGQTLAAGFQRFPQVLTNTVRIAFGTDGADESTLIQAAHLISSLQRASTTPLTVNLVTLADFGKASYPGVVIAATPADAAALKTPLRFEAWRAVDASGKKFTVTVDGPFAALEAFDAGGRDLLILGGTAPAGQSSVLTDSLAIQADANPFGWFVLTGDLLVAQPGLPLLALSTATIVPQASVANEFTVPLWLIIAVAVLLLVIVARLIAVGRRKQRIVNDDNL